MKPMLSSLAAILLVLAGPASASGPKSALDNFQFDGVSSDAELKVEHHSRRQWLDAHPVQAKDYWRAWDCKGKPCDSKWNANIRAKAAKITRTEQDPPPATDSKATGT